MRRLVGAYTLQAAIAACHALAACPKDTDWMRVVALYDALVELTGSPVVELNRAVAVSMAYGPAEGLSLVDELSDDPALRDYHLLPAVRVELLLNLGRGVEAKVELENPAVTATNPRQHPLLIRRAPNCTLPFLSPHSTSLPR